MHLSKKILIVLLISFLISKAKQGGTKQLELKEIKFIFS